MEREGLGTEAGVLCREGGRGEEGNGKGKDSPKTSSGVQCQRRLSISSCRLTAAIDSVVSA